MYLQLPSSSSSSSSSSVFAAGPSSFIHQKAANFSSRKSFNTSQFSALASTFSRVSLLRHVASPTVLRSTPSFLCFASGKRNLPALLSVSVSLCLCLWSLFPLVSLFFIQFSPLSLLPMISFFVLNCCPFFNIMWILCLLEESVSLRDFLSIRSCTWTILYQYSVPVFYFIFNAFPIIEIFYSCICLIFILPVLLMHLWMLVLLIAINCSMPHQ